MAKKRKTLRIKWRVKMVLTIAGPPWVLRKPSNILSEHTTEEWQAVLEKCKVDAETLPFPRDILNKVSIFCFIIFRAQSLKKGWMLKIINNILKYNFKEWILLHYFFSIFFSYFIPSDDFSI